jgi:serine/threonine protein kinase
MTRSVSVRPQTPRGTAGLGTLEDRYRSLFLLGRGGMGRIEVALERSGSGTTERIVALKRLLPESARDPRRKEMFLREARLGALLAHPNVVRAFAFGEIYDELFLAMEYVEGEPLSRVLSALRDSAGTLGQALTCHVLAQACEGLHAAHELAGPDGKALNVVHRDVSPQNVMIAYDGRVKLLDFGVAKLDTADHQTRTGEVKGKMAYMSPEQALGDKLDRRSDLFSIGAVLFECLTGQPMWGAGTDVELMRKLALEQPPLLDSADGRVAPGLAALHASLVAREPSMRPRTAREVADGLRALGTELEARDATASLVLLMSELFGRAAADRRALLAEALEREAPSRAEALRRTLEPGAVLRQPSTAEPVLVIGPPMPRKGRRGAIVAGAVLATVAAGSAVVGAGARRGPEPSAIAPAQSAQSTPSTATTAPSPTPSEVTTAAPTVASTPTVAAAPTVTAPAKKSAPSPARAVSAAPTRAHDVDPTPF